MEKSTVRMSALAFEVAKKVATKLARSGSPDDGRIGNALPEFEREMAEQFALGAAVLDGALAEGMFKCQEPVFGDDWRTVDRADDAGGWGWNVDQDDFAKRKINACGREDQSLTNVVGAFAQNGAPFYLPFAIGALQESGELMSGKPLGITGGIWICRNLFGTRSRCEVQEVRIDACAV